jgi:hypothetical protein
LKVLMAAGIAGLALGIYGLSRSAPYQTVYPLLLLSAIALAIPALALPGVRKRTRRSSPADAAMTCDAPPGF